MTASARSGQSRELIVFLIRKELKVRYKNSVLGFVWSFLNPALVLGVYYVVFKYFLPNHLEYFAIYLFAGLLRWNLFNNSLLSSAGVLVAHAGIVKKVAFPREILALAQVGTAICYFFFQSCIMVVFLVGFQVQPDWKFMPVAFFALVCDIVLSAGAGGLPVGRQRLPARRPAPHRGRARGPVLQPADRLPVLDSRREVGEAPPVVALPGQSPRHDRALLPALRLRECGAEGHARARSPDYRHALVPGDAEHRPRRLCRARSWARWWSSAGSRATSPRSSEQPCRRRSRFRRSRSDFASTRRSTPL